MTRLDDVLDLHDLAEMLDLGFVRERSHPTYPQLRILNYSEKAQYENVWNATTKACRGLIYNAYTLEVLARPFAKFFNYGQDADLQIDLDAPVYHVGDKADGSLGILYLLPGGAPAIATRGSFDSDQARHATKLLHDSGLAWVHAEEVEEGFTRLYEIIYPENRIVLNYGDRDELINLGWVRIDNGAYIPPSWSARNNAIENLRTVRQVIEAEPRVNAEGYVVWLDPFTAVKFKQEDYVALHRIVTGLNKKSIWRALKDDTYDELIEQIPDELFDWADGVAGELYDQFVFIESAAIAAFHGNGGFSGSQKEFALSVQQSVTDQKIRGLVFSLRNEKSLTDSIWKMLEPVGGER